MGITQFFILSDPYVKNFRLSFLMVLNFLEFISIMILRI